MKYKKIRTAPLFKELVDLGYRFYFPSRKRNLTPKELRNIIIVIPPVGINGYTTLKIHQIDNIDGLYVHYSDNNCAVKVNSVASKLLIKLKALADGQYYEVTRHDDDY